MSPRPPTIRNANVDALLQPPELASDLVALLAGQPIQVFLPGGRQIGLEQDVFGFARNRPPSLAGVRHQPRHDGRIGPDRPEFDPGHTLAAHIIQEGFAEFRFPPRVHHDIQMIADIRTPDESEQAAFPLERGDPDQPAALPHGKNQGLGRRGEYLPPCVQTTGQDEWGGPFQLIPGHLKRVGQAFKCLRADREITGCQARRRSTLSHHSPTRHRAPRLVSSTTTSARCRQSRSMSASAQRFSARK